MLVIMDGYHSNQRTSYSDYFVYDPDANEFFIPKIEGTMPDARRGAAVMQSSSTTFNFFGGCAYANTRCFNDMYSVIVQLV